MSNRPPTQEEARRFKEVVRLCSEGSRVNTGRYAEYVGWAVLTRRIKHGPYSWSWFLSTGGGLCVECEVTVQSRRKWFRTVPGFKVIVMQEPGFWWEAFRELLPLWEAEVVRPENIGWQKRARDEEQREKMAQQKREREAKIEKARRALG